jgi:frataxin
MKESDFHRLADHWLTTAADVLEEADASGSLDVEYQNGALTVICPSKKTFVISKHAPTQQLWLSSPISGGLHFSYTDSHWALADGRILDTLLSKELQALAGIDIIW